MLGKNTGSVNKLLLIPFFLFVFIALQCSEAFAINSHFIVKRVPSGNSQFNGGSYRAVTKGMSAGNNSEFALRTMWLEVNGKGSGDCIENGFMDGNLNGSYYHGFYTANGHIINNILYYNEYSIVGPSTANDTTHDYQVTYLGNQTYGVVVDGTNYRNVTGRSPGGSWMQIGLEGSSANASWATTYTSQHKTKDGSGTWSFWSSGTTVISDPLGLGYTCTFPYSNDYTVGKYWHP